jgi:hypothetical protein
MEDACAQPQASKQAGALAQTAPQDGRGPPAGSSLAGYGSVERRRSSVVVVVLSQHHENKGAAATAAAVVVAQVRVTLMAIGLVIMMAPIAAVFEPLVEFFSRALPNFMPLAPCQGLLTDRRGVDLVVVFALGFFVAQTGLQVAVVDANPRAIRFLRQALLVGTAASIVCAMWYASAYASTVESPSHAIIYGFMTGFVVTLAPFVSFVAWGLMTAKRKSYKRAVREVFFGVSASVNNVFGAIVTAFYVNLSDEVSGSAGLIINGRWC